MVERFPLERISWFLIADLTPIDCLPDLAAGFVPRSALSSPYYNRVSYANFDYTLPPAACERVDDYCLVL